MFFFFGIYYSDSVNQQEKNCAKQQPINVTHYDAHTVYPKHTMKMDVNVASVKIHAVVTHVQMNQDALLISHKLIRHLHQFAVNVRKSHMKFDNLEQN